MLVSVSCACHPAGMGKKRGILVIVLFVALLGGSASLLSRPTEPAYQGKPLSAWLNEFNGVPEDTSQAAYVAFRGLGTNAIPALLKTLQSGDRPFQKLILELNRVQSLVHFPVRDTWPQSLAASIALYAMGANATPAIPALTNLLFHSSTVLLSALSAVPLAGMGSEGLAPLIEALTNQNASIRESAATGLSYERSDLNIVVPALIARLSDKNRLVHRTAVEVLGRLHAEPGLAVPALMKDFPGNDPLLRGMVLEALGRFETNASVAVPMLLEALSDNDQYVSNKAASALQRIGSAAAAQAGVK